MCQVLIAFIVSLSVMYFYFTAKVELDNPYKSVQRMEVVSYLYEHGPLCLHHHLQQRFNQSLRCSWDQVEKVDDGRTDLHLLQKESREKKRVDEILGKMTELDTDSF